MTDLSIRRAIGITLIAGCMEWMGRAGFPLLSFLAPEARSEGLSRCPPRMRWAHPLEH